MCGYGIREDKSSGFNCVRCRAHYSARFVLRMRRNHVRHIIAQHFTEQEYISPRASVEQISFTINDTNGITQALKEAKLAAENTKHHLQRLLVQRQYNEHRKHARQIMIKEREEILKILSKYGERNISSNRKFPSSENSSFGSTIKGEATISTKLDNDSPVSKLRATSNITSAQENKKIKENNQRKNKPLVKKKH